MSKYFGMFCKLNFVFLINGLVCILFGISWGHFYRIIFSFSFFKDCFFATCFVIYVLIGNVCFLFKIKNLWRLWNYLILFCFRALPIFSFLLSPLLENCGVNVDTWRCVCVSEGVCIYKYMNMGLLYCLQFTWVDLLSNIPRSWRRKA